jgi:hypothetical protein
MFFFRRTREAFSDKQRQIFRYWDGAKVLRADPAVILQEMSAHPTTNFDTEPRIMRQQDTFGQEAYDSVLVGIRDVFKLKPISEDGGLTEIETLDVWIKFQEFITGLKKTFSLRPIILPTQAQASSATAGSPIEQPSASLSHGSEPCTVGPKSSP